MWAIHIDLLSDCCVICIVEPENERGVLAECWEINGARRASLRKSTNGSQPVLYATKAEESRVTP